MYKFNNNNIITGYIKEVLHSFNLPQCHVLTPGMRVFPNSDYIYQNKLYKFVGKTSVVLSTDLSVLPVDMKAVHNYFYGHNVQNLTKNLEISGPLYDTYTHEYLGDYLRFRRDYLEINLMSMYNCFSNNVAVSLNIDDGNIKFNSASNEYKIYAVPVKFFQEYTIGIDCDTSVEMFCGFYDNGIIALDDGQTSLNQGTYLKKVGTKFKKPFVYKNLKLFGTISDAQYAQEMNLVLFLKIPSSCNSSITILEGDYLNNCEHYFEEGVEKISNLSVLYKNETTGEDISNYVYLTKLQLFNINSNISYPFADRFVEYLFGNVVDSSDEIGDNIKRVQSILLKNDIDVNLKTVNNYGEWDNDIRKTIYANEILSDIINKTFDSIGYYDKDIEEMLGEEEE